MQRGLHSGIGLCMFANRFGTDPLLQSLPISRLTASPSDWIPENDWYDRTGDSRADDADRQVAREHHSRPAVGNERHRL